MEKKSIKKNYIYNMLYQMVVLLTPLVTTPYMSRVLGSAGIGTVSYIESISSYFVLVATMGITTYGQREISYYQDSKKERSMVFWNTKSLECIISGIVLIVYIIFALTRVDKTLYIIMALNILAVFFDVTWFFPGMEEFGLVAARNIVIKILQIIYYFSFIKTENDLWLYVLGLGVFSLIGNLSLWLGLRKFIEFVPLREIRPFTNIKTVFILFLPTIATQIYSVLDKTMIGVITQNAMENGYYEQATKISRCLIAGVTSLTAVMVPRVAFLFKQDNKKAVEELMEKSFRFLFVVSLPMCFGLMGIANNFVPWFLGDDFLNSIVLVRILALLILATGMNSITGSQYLIATGKENFYTKSLIIGAVINFFLNIFLIKRYNSMGAAIASVAAEMFIAGIQLFYIRKDFSIRKILRLGTNYYIATFAMVMILMLFDKVLISSIINTIIMILFGAIVYLVVLILLKDSFFMEQAIYYVTRVRSKLKK